MFAPKNADNKQKIVVSSTSGNLQGYLYWSSVEKLYLLVFRDPSDPRARRRLKKRVPDEKHARRLLDDTEVAWKEAWKAAREKEIRPQYLTPEQQEDALRALGLLGGRLSLTEAVSALLAIPELKKAAAMPDPKALRKALAGVLDRGARLHPPGSDSGDFKLTDRTTIREAINAFFRHKREQGASAATLLTYETRLRWLLEPGLAIHPLKPTLTKALIAGMCLRLSERTAYGFLTATSSFESFLFETKGLVHHEPDFSIQPIREASAFFNKDGVFFRAFPRHREKPVLLDGDYFSPNWFESKKNLAEVEQFLVGNAFVSQVHLWYAKHPDGKGYVKSSKRGTK